MTTTNTEGLKREQILKLICDNTGKRINLPNFTIEELEDFAKAIRQAALEEAALECESWHGIDGKGAAKHIRALSTTPAEPVQTPDATLVDDALAKVSELGTVGAMKWLYASLQTPDCATTPSAQEAQSAITGWLPIESAPKDGTWILATSGKAVWQAKYRKITSESLKCEAQFGDGWTRFNSCDTGLNPTHWMPLPEVPK